LRRTAKIDFFKWILVFAIITFVIINNGYFNLHWSHILAFLNVAFKFLVPIFIIYILRGWNLNFWFNVKYFFVWAHWSLHLVHARKKSKRRRFFLFKIIIFIIIDIFWNLIFLLWNWSNRLHTACNKIKWWGLCHILLKIWCLIDILLNLGLVLLLYQTWK